MPWHGSEKLLDVHDRPQELVKLLTSSAQHHAHDVIILFTFSGTRLFTKTPFSSNKQQITPVFCDKMI